MIADTAGGPQARRGPLSRRVWLDFAHGAPVGRRDGRPRHSRTLPSTTSALQQARPPSVRAHLVGDRRASLLDAGGVALRRPLHGLHPARGVRASRHGQPVAPRRGRHVPPEQAGRRGRAAAGRGVAAPQLHSQLEEGQRPRGLNSQASKGAAAFILLLLPLESARRTRAPPRESGADLRGSVDAIVWCAT